VLIHEDKNEPDLIFDLSVTNDGKYALLSTFKDCDELCKVAYADLTDN